MHDQRGNPNRNRCLAPACKIWEALLTSVEIAEMDAQKIVSCISRTWVVFRWYHPSRDRADGRSGTWRHLDVACGASGRQTAASVTDNKWLQIQMTESISWFLLPLTLHLHSMPEMFIKSRCIEKWLQQVSTVNPQLEVAPWIWEWCHKLFLVILEWRPKKCKSCPLLNTEIPDM